MKILHLRHWEHGFDHATVIFRVWDLRKTCLLNWSNIGVKNVQSCYWVLCTKPTQRKPIFSLCENTKAIKWKVKLLQKFEMLISGGKVTLGDFALQVIKRNIRYTANGLFVNETTLGKSEISQNKILICWGTTVFACMDMRTCFFLWWG